jgi:intracellular sulfur oxidation DsrE/DsrF family protein
LSADGGSSLYAASPIFSFTKEPSMPYSRFHRFVTGVVVVLSLAVAGAAAAQAPHASVRPRVVLQMSEADPAKWSLALNNAKNIQTDLGAANVDIELVAYGPGIGMLKADSIVGNRVDEAIAAGVKVVACENTMRNQKLSQVDMLKKISYVQAGVVEIMQRQQQGWAYIRP